MVSFRSIDALTLSQLDFLRIVQPDLDTKPGTVGREIFVDVNVQELAKLYVELRSVANLQAISAATGLTLDRLASNFGVVRSTGSAASGVAILSTNALEFDINVPAGTIITARNGFTFRTLNQTAFISSNSSVYQANAIRLSASLDTAGIADQFALEVAVEAISVGAGGNIGKFSLSTQTIAGISNVTNAEGFTGGSNTESDSSFRSRVLGVFAGSNIGTALGYQNALLVNPSISDVLTVEPGDPLMTRDGSQSSINDDGEAIIISSGSGGKVDLYILGTDTEDFSESFIFRDRSGKGDVTDPLNDFVLGQRGISTALDFQQRRRLSLRNGILPFQPVDNIVSVTGSLSGPNFTLAFTDAEGEQQGSFELVKDTGEFGGSAFGFDKLHFVASNIDLSNEAETKGIFNGQDAFDFTDVTSISRVHQNIVLRNEGAQLVGSNRSFIRLTHTPLLSVDRIINSTTGERYNIVNSNPNGVAGQPNTDGVVQISGNTLPVSTDNVEASYLWDPDYDNEIDYDNLETTSDFRTVQDSIDWGFSNRVLEEAQTVLFSIADGYHILLNHPATRVVNINDRLSESVVSTLGKLVVSTAILNIASITDAAGREVFYTAANNGAFSGSEITLPTDTLLANGESATVVYNTTDLFSPDGYETGTFSGNVVKFATGVLTTVGGTLYADYVSNVSILLPTTALSSVPAVGFNNNFIVNSSSIGSQPVTNIFSGTTIVRNLRFAPSYLRMNVQGVTNRGTLTIQGTSFIRIEDVITITQDSLTLNLSDSIRNSLGLASVPSTGYVGYLGSMERVTVEGDQVTGIEHAFDILNYQLKKIQYSNGTAIVDSSLTSTQVELSATSANVNNIPSTGQRIRVVYYFVNSNQTENVPVAASGVLYSKYKYAFVSRVSIASGFTGVAGNIAGNITINNANQPVSGTSYNSSYRYTAPKEGERITVNYNFNKLISDSTFNIENVRPITADVLVKAATAVPIDITMQVVPINSLGIDSTNLRQSLESAITSFVTANGLNTTLDASDVINASYAVPGVDRVTITRFNFEGELGIRKSIVADRDEFLTAGSIEIEIESR